ncbi:MAG: prolipoprotein diacylglyceryl transferase [Candidatus Omnitrophica bacterium]|nr:prolipoprotein diacylglyceryl transferase [Candidatus Omnitrophota bacterium]
MRPILFSFFKINIYSYGLMVALGIVLAVSLIERDALKSGLPKDEIIDLIFWVVIWGLVGARVVYVLLYPEAYLDAPWDILKIYQGGLIFHGSLIFGTIAALINFKNKKLPVFKTLDLLMLYLPLAHAFGRIGCFLNGCCYGKTTDLAWGIRFSENLETVHPSQLYSAFLLLILFLGLFLIRRKQVFDGQIFCLYLIFYGLIRFCIEFVRDNPIFAWGLSIYQYISLILIAAGIFAYIRLKKAN